MRDSGIYNLFTVCVFHVVVRFSIVIRLSSYVPMCDRFCDLLFMAYYVYGHYVIDMVMLYFDFFIVLFNYSFIVPEQRSQTYKGSHRARKRGVYRNGHKV